MIIEVVLIVANCIEIKTSVDGSPSKLRPSFIQFNET